MVPMGLQGEDGQFRAIPDRYSDQPPPQRREEVQESQKLLGQPKKNVYEDPASPAAPYPKP